MFFPYLIWDTRTESCLTTIFPRGQATYVPAHGHETVEVVLQALVGLLVQAGDDAELGPVKRFLLLIEHDTEGRHCSVEVCLLPPCPPEI